MGLTPTLIPTFILTLTLTLTLTVARTLTPTLTRTRCVQQSLVSRTAESSAGDKAEGGKIRGFKELLQLPSLDAGGEFASD